MYEQIQETTAYLKGRIKNLPEIGIILGSGLGNLGNQIEVDISIPYGEIPNFPVSTVKGHSGHLIFGKLGGKNVVALQGRFHYYEGYTMQEVTFPVRVMQAFAVKALILSNAAGGMNPAFKVGDIMLISDHINMFPDNPLMGPNDDRLGDRFPDMSEVYSKEFLVRAHKIAKDNNILVHEGVYAGTSGPTFETPAEYKYFRNAGGDTVGMSTVPEAIVARHAGIPCFGTSIVTDLGIADQVEKVSHEEVLKAAKAAEPKLTTIVTELIKTL